MSTANRTNRRRVASALAATVAALLWIALLHATLPVAWATVLLDQGGIGYPLLSIQVYMWIAFFIAASEVVQRLRATRRENALFARHLLPEDERTVLVAEDLGAIYRRVRQDSAAGDVLAGLIQRCILQFQTSRSAERATHILTANVELCLHEIDMRYTVLRYIMWLIPSLGFLGTVVGIALTLQYLGAADMQDPTLLSEVTRRLAVKFNTTLVGVAMATLVVLGANLAQMREERALNRAAQYCLDNLINRLFEGRAARAA